MRASLADAALARYAGRFVWLELDYDKEVNQPFIARHGVQWTPTLLVLDAAAERVTAQHAGGMTIAELSQFLERGERGAAAAGAPDAAHAGDAGDAAHAGHAAGAGDAALARGDALAGAGRHAEAAAAYREALRIGGGDWRARARAADAMTSALILAGDERACAEAATAYAPAAPRDRVFVRVVGAGLGCANDGGAAPWAVAARKTLAPLADEGLAVGGALRDNRFFLFQQLTASALLAHDDATARRIGHRWLAELDATRPADDDERSALDIARVDAVSLLDEPERALPALAASERAMPKNYSAAMRHAEVAADARHWDEALAACTHGLALVDGPMGRTRLLWIRARALAGKHDDAAARRAVDEGLRSAQKIPSERVRQSYVHKLQSIR